MGLCCKGNSSFSGADCVELVKLTETLRDPVLADELIRRWLAIGLFLVMVEVIAYWIGTERTSTLEFCAAIAIVVLTTVGLQDRAWIIILLAWAMTGNTSKFPFGLSIHDVCILLAACAYVAYRILTQAPSRRKAHPLDFLLGINLAWIVVTFVMHPVGFNIFGSATIGGRPYINIALASAAYWVIVRLPRSLRSVSRIPYYLLVGATVAALLNLVVYVVPSATVYLYPFYGGVDLNAYFSSTSAGGVEVQRLIGVRPFGITLSLLLCAYHEPRELFNPMRPWLYLLLLGFVTVLAGGFRSTCLGIMAMVTIGAWLHRGWRGSLAVVFLGGLLMGGLIVGQGRFYQLPFPAQRALSFLPGQWSAEARGQGESSTQGRFDWWKDVIKYDLIGDWWFGDGFGLSKRDIESAEGTASAKGGGALFDYFTLTGNFHSGPLTAIRYAGIVGFALFYVLMLASAYYSVKCVQLCHGTCLQPAAIFVAVQLLWLPIDYIFIFGAYDSQVGEQIFLIALVLLLMRMSGAARQAANLTVSAAVPQPTPQFAHNLR
jgi:hypothetical protein